jgi:hypothetical protein
VLLGSSDDDKATLSHQDTLPESRVSLLMCAHAALLVVDRPEAFRREVNHLVARQRATLKRNVLASPVF